MHEHEVFIVDLAEELAADHADDGGHSQDDQDPAAADDLALAHLMLGLDGQIAHKDVRHAEVAQAMIMAVLALMPVTVLNSVPQAEMLEAL